MKGFLPAIALVLLILASGPAQASLFNPGGTVIIVGDAHAGTQYRYALRDEFRLPHVHDVTIRDLVVAVEDDSAAFDRRGHEVRDRFGDLRLADTYRIDAYDDMGQLVASERCHALARGHDTLRREVLDGRAPAFFPLSPRGLSMGETRVETSGGFRLVDERTLASSGAIAFDPEPCFARLLPQVTLRAGQVVPLDVLFPHVPGAHASRSAPAVATEHAGYPALRLRYDIAPLAAASGTPGVRGHVDVVLAHLSAVPVRIALDARMPTSAGDAHVVMERELTGFLGGNGYVLHAPDGATMPPRNPGAVFEAYEPSALPTAALPLAYPFEDAMAALRSDPTLRFAEFEASGAVVAAASYDRRMPDAEAPAAPTDGGWDILLARADGSTYAARSVRVALTGAAGLDGPTVSKNSERTSSPFDPPGSLPAQVSSRSLASLLDAQGLVAERVDRLAYTLGSDGKGEAAPRLLASDVSAHSGETEGITLVVDLASAGLDAAYVTHAVTRPGLLPSDPAFTRTSLGASREGTGPAFPAGPLAWGAYGAAAATGVGLAVLFAKLVAAPLYTRLRRDRLLDHPIRARLMARSREEPGVSRQELVDDANVGEGATRRHLDMLVKHGLLVPLRANNRIGYYVAGDVPPESARRALHLRGEAAQRVHDLYEQEPSISLREAAKRLGMSAPGVHRVRSRLEKAGLLPRR